MILTVYNSTKDVCVPYLHNVVDIIIYTHFLFLADFQKIQIVHSKTLGNMLILDELQSKFI